jgi:hypothetical protein
MGKFSEWLHELPARIRRASKAEAGLFILKNAAVMFQIYFGIELARTRLNGQTPSDLAIKLYLGSVVVTTIAHFIPPRVFRTSKRTISATKRASSYAAALEALSLALARRSMLATDFQRVIQNIMVNIVSELEAMFGDVDGTEFMAILWERSPNPDAFRVIGSSTPDIPQDRDFPSRNLTAKKALTLNEHAYEPNRKIDASELKEWQDYHCVLAYPICLFNGAPRAALSLKSRRTGHFDGHIPQVYGRLSPAIRLIELALECYKHYGPETYSRTQEPTHAAKSERAVGRGRSSGN